MSDAPSKASHVSESHAASSSTSKSNDAGVQARLLTESTDFSSLSDLKAKSPKLYNFMMQSIAQNICIQIKHQQDKLAEKWKEMRES